MGTKNLCRILFENPFLSIPFPYFRMIFGRASIGKGGYPFRKNYTVRYVVVREVLAFVFIKTLNSFYSDIVLPIELFAVL